MILLLGVTQKRWAPFWVGFLSRFFLMSHFFPLQLLPLACTLRIKMYFYKAALSVSTVYGLWLFVWSLLFLSVVDVCLSQMQLDYDWGFNNKWIKHLVWWTTVRHNDVLCSKMKLAKLSATFSWQKKKEFYYCTTCTSKGLPSIWLPTVYTLCHYTPIINT